VSLDSGVSEEDLLVHDETGSQPALAYLLSRMDHPEFPIPLGVIRCLEKPTYEKQLIVQEQTAKAEKGDGDLAELYQAADTWTIAGES